MTEEDLEKLFGKVRTFGWDENKRQTNVAKHGIDFLDAEGVFKDPAAFTYRSSRPTGEQRYVTIGAVKGVLIAVISTLRQGTIRIIPRARLGAVRGRIMADASKNQDEYIVKHVGALPDGTHIIEHPDGRLERQKSETNWARLDALTDAEIDASIANDPDWSDDWNWSDAVLVIPPKKKAISIRVDEDVLDYFKQEGAGYQRRINAVLRSYMQQKGKRKTRA